MYKKEKEIIVESPGFGGWLLMEWNGAYLYLECSFIDESSLRGITGLLGRSHVDGLTLLSVACALACETRAVGALLGGGCD